jgi:uncharacterized protein
MKRIIWTYSLILLTALSLPAQQPVLTAGDGEALWVRWPGHYSTALEGYHVYRQQSGSTDWQRLTAQALAPDWSVAGIREALGVRAGLFLHLFGVDAGSQAITPAQRRELFGTEQGRNFLGAQALVNPEFGHVLAEIFRDTTARPGTSYRYRVTVVEAGSERDWAQSGTVACCTSTPVPVPQEVEGEGRHQSVLLYWKREAEALRSGQLATFRVYRAMRPIGPFQRANVAGMLPVRVTAGAEGPEDDRHSYSDRFLENGTTYYYYVAGVDAFGRESSPSALVTVTPEDHRLPPPPSGLEAAPFGSGVRLRWEQPDRPVKGYELWRATERGGPFTRIHPVTDLALNTATQAIDGPVPGGVPHYYFAVSVSDAGLRSHTTDTLVVLLPDLDAPAPPEGVRAIPERGRMVLTWRPNTEPDLLGYEVERASDSKFRTRFLLTSSPVTDTTYIDSLPEQTETVFGYVVYAVDRNGNRSAPSEIIMARLPDVVPPQAPILTRVERKGKVVHLAWTANPERDLDHYRVYRSTDGKAYMPVRSPAGNITTDTLTEGGTYWYAVSALDQTGNESEQSAAVRTSYDPHVRPSPPVNGTLEERDGIIYLTWEAPADGPVAGYLVVRKELDTGRSSDLGQAEPEDRSFRDRSVRKGRAYEYRIYTRDGRWRMSDPLVLQFDPGK